MLLFAAFLQAFRSPFFRFSSPFSSRFRFATLSRSAAELFQFSCAFCTLSFDFFDIFSADVFAFDAAIAFHASISAIEASRRFFIFSLQPFRRQSRGIFITLSAISEAFIAAAS